jgi:hypothetical protein
MPDQVEQLLQSLLWEGYALYPYTPGATKNATPTPFGIVYPPAYAAGASTTYDELVMRARLHAPAESPVSAEVLFLAPTGERHQAEEHRLVVQGVMVGALVHAPAIKPARIRGAGGDSLRIEVRLSATAVGPGEFEVTVRVANRTVVPHCLDRAEALHRSLISTHPVARVIGGRFISVLEARTNSVNTFPVLATPNDDVIVGAAIVLPDHPQLAPESQVGMFDSTEMDEALLLHLKVLTDGELAEIEQQDPVVREMVARAAAATPAEISALHGRVTLSDPAVMAPPRSRETNEPPREPDWLRDPREGEEVTEVNGVILRRGGKVMLRPGQDADVHSKLLDGRCATLERIFTDYDGRTHLGVTIDGDPGQDLMRETGRYLFFFLDEVEVISV